MSARDASGAEAPSRERARRIWLRMAGVWAVLMALLLATWGAAYLPLGAWKPVVALGIATIKAGIVIWIYMELSESRAIYRFAALAGLLWVLLLISLTFADEATRSHLPGAFPSGEAAPAEAPPSAPQLPGPDR